MDFEQWYNKYGVRILSEESNAKKVLACCWIAATTSANSQRAARKKRSTKLPMEFIKFDEMDKFEEWWCKVLAWDEEKRGDIKETARSAWEASKSIAQQPQAKTAEG